MLSSVPDREKVHNAYQLVFSHLIHHWPHQCLPSLLPSRLRVFTFPVFVLQSFPGKGGLRGGSTGGDPHEISFSTILIFNSTKKHLFYVFFFDIKLVGLGMKVLTFQKCMIWNEGPKSLGEGWQASDSLGRVQEGV